MAVGLSPRAARCGGHADALLAACARSIPLAELTAAVGPPALVRPVLFHLLWAHLLSVDLTRPLTDATPVTPSAVVQEVLR